MPEMIADIDDDHLRVLALARLAFSVESGPEWTRDMLSAADKHGAACDAVWRELRRQVDLQDGVIPTLEHPSRQAQKLAKRMRSEIVATVQSAVEEALDDFIFTGSEREPSDG